jgi:peroxiredoxin
MPAYNEDLEKFAGYDAQVVGIGVDSVFCSMAWQKFELGMLRYPLASDFWPHGEVARKYGVFLESGFMPGISGRAVFVVDKAGKIAFSKLYQISDVPPNEEVFEVLKKLQQGKS